jgi:hypothetical protein
MRVAMKLRNAAALALVGWYLMMPPWYEGQKEPDLSAPFMNWDIVASYDSAKDCMDDLVKAQTDAKQRRTPLERRQFGMQCIATDDPRFKNR